MLTNLTDQLVARGRKSLHGGVMAVACGGIDCGCVDAYHVPSSISPSLLSKVGWATLPNLSPRTVYAVLLWN